MAMAREPVENNINLNPASSKPPAAKRLLS
jgi:hypothetical protein